MKKNERNYSKLQIAGGAIMSGFLALSMPLSALAQEYDIGNGSITVDAKDDGQYVTQENGADNEFQDSPTVITGESNENTVTINAEEGQTAEVTLSDVNINAQEPAEAAVNVTGEGSVTIELDGENYLKGGKKHAGLEDNLEGTLTIQDENDNSGSLSAIGGSAGAGIGGGEMSDGSDITITGGSVTAEGRMGGAGIGGGYIGDGNRITITGGEVNAYGGNINSSASGGGGAGIGGGKETGAEDITITGGTVTAVGKYGGAGIGGGFDENSSSDSGNVKNITISGDATVTAIGGNGGGAGIGLGRRVVSSDPSTVENITISEAANVKVAGGIDGGEYHGAAIGYGTAWYISDGTAVDPDTEGLYTTGKIEYYNATTTLDGITDENLVATVVGTVDPSVVPNPTPGPDPEPTPGPGPEPSPEPTPGPTPAPEPTPAPAPAADPVTQDSGSQASSGSASYSEIPAGAITIALPMALASSASGDAGPKVLGAVNKPSRAVSLKMSQLTDAQFQSAVITNISKTPDGGVLTLESDRIACLDKAMLEAFANKGNVDMEVLFPLGKSKIRVVIPAGYDISKLLDKKGYCGYLRLLALIGGEVL